MCFQAHLIVGETNPLPDPITAPSVITYISDQLEGVTGDRAAATVKADDRILEKLSKLKDAEPFRANREAAASLSPDFPPPHRLVSAKMIFNVAPTSRRELRKARGVAIAHCRRMIWCFPALLALVRVGGCSALGTESALQTAYSAAGAQTQAQFFRHTIRARRRRARRPSAHDVVDLIWETLAHRRPNAGLVGVDGPRRNRYASFRAVLAQDTRRHRL